MEQTESYGRYKTLFSILAIALLIWGALGALDITQAPYTGYIASPDSVVTEVRDGSPAETAGLRVGDRVTRIDGVPVESVSGLYERGRPAIGATGSLTVTREGVEKTIPVTYASRPAYATLTSIIGVLTGLAFLILGLMAYLRNPTRLSTIFCALSMMLAFLFLAGPYVTSPGLRRVLTAMGSFVVGYALATLLYYCLIYPRVKEVLATRPWLRQAIFIVAPLMGITFMWLDLLAANVSSNNSMILSTLGNVIFGGYILLAVIAVIHSYMKSSPGERTASGLNLMMLGLLIGFGPLLISVLYHTIFSHAGDLPGERFWPITTIAVPIGMALGLMKLEHAPSRVKAGGEVAT